MTPVIAALERLAKDARALSELSEEMRGVGFPELVEADVAILKAALTEGGEAVEVLRAWGEARKRPTPFPPCVPGPAEQCPQCTLDAVERDARNAAEAAADRLAQKGAGK